VDAQSDLLERGFQLASFVVHDRAAALGILSSSLNKLKAHSLQESKRAYWRDKHLKRQITKISRSEADAFQWLIYLECEYYEKEREQSIAPTAEDMALRYIRSLVRITTARSSFYVNIGLHRLLYNYSTAETQRVYELMTGRFLGPDEYRRAKLSVMRKLRARFGKFLKTVRTGHGELRFEVCADQTPWFELVQRCLAIFIPWSTSDRCLAPSEVHQLSGIPSPTLSTNENEILTPDSIEAHRCHVLIHPVCNRRLLEALGIFPSAEKLAMPLFRVDNNSSDGRKSGNHGQNAPLTEEERKTIKDTLLSESNHRRRIPPSFLRILVDGTECTRCDVSDDAEANFEIGEDAELIEIWTESNGKDLLLGTHLIRRRDGKGIAPAEAAIFLGTQRKLLLTVSPAPEPSLGARGATVSLRCQSISSWATWTVLRELFALWPGSVPKYALVAITLLLIGWTATYMYLDRSLTSQRGLVDRKEKEITAAKITAAELREQLQLQQKMPVPISTYRLVPDDSVVRGTTGPAFPEILLPFHPALINLELPLDSSLPRHYRATLRPFLNKQSILTENDLAHLESPSGPALVFSLPSSVVKPNLDYTIELSLARYAGKFDVVNSFSFHVRPAH
jgi:hypothetical protein